MRYQIIWQVLCSMILISTTRAMQTQSTDATKATALISLLEARNFEAESIKQELQKLTLVQIEMLRKELLIKYEPILNRYFQKGVSSFALGAPLPYRELNNAKHATVTVACHPQKPLAAIGSHVNVSFWNLENPNKPVQLQHPEAQNITDEHQVTALAFSAHENYCAVAQYGKPVQLFDIQDQKKPIIIYRHHVRPNTAVLALSHDKSKLIISNDLDVSLICTASRQTLPSSFIKPPDTIHSCDFSHTDRFIVMGCEDGSCLITDTKTSTTRVFKTHAITAVACNPRCNYLLTGSENNNVKLWDFSHETPRELAQLPGHTKSITCVKFSPDGNYIATSGHDGVIRLWHIDIKLPKSTEQCIPVFIGEIGERSNSSLLTLEDTVHAFDFGPRMAYILMGSYNNNPRLWQLEQASIIHSISTPQLLMLIAFLNYGQPINDLDPIFQSLPDNLQQYLKAITELRTRFHNIKDLEQLILGYISHFNFERADEKHEAGSCCIA
jgi:WD40 repeat protein